MRPRATIRSFGLVIYQERHRLQRRFSLPVSVAAPFVRRLWQELGEKNVRELWYELSPGTSPAPTRSPRPVGPTSLYGAAYEVEREPPPRVALHPEAEITWFTVHLLDGERELFQGIYTVDDLFLAGAEFLVQGLCKKGDFDPSEGPFYYKLEVSSQEAPTAPENVFGRDTPEIEGVFSLPQLDPNRQRIQFRLVPSPPLPEYDSTHLDDTQSHGRGKPGEGMIFMHADVYQSLRHDVPLSSRIEDGGYLLGYPYRQPGSPVDEEDPGFRWLLKITDLVKAESAVGHPGLLFFTGETWSRIARRIDCDYPDKKLVSWFHTHLFKASDDFGLSGLDQDLHRRFLNKPWQIAVLVNIDVSSGEREVRCFQRGPQSNLVECRFEVFCSTREEKKRSLPLVP